MNKLSNLNEGRQKISELGGIYMPDEFMEIYKSGEFTDKILNRPKEPFRFFQNFDVFLSQNGNNLPTSVYELAKECHYPKHIIELFNVKYDKRYSGKEGYVGEDGYKKEFSKINEYPSFFETKSDYDKKQIFNSADFGARSVFELQQDVIAGNLFEDLLVDNSLGGFHPNPKATNRGTQKVSTSCDLIYETPSIFKDKVKLEVEIKTKWDWKLYNDLTIDMRGNSKKVFEAEGMILAIYMYLNKAVLIDSKGQNNIIQTTKYGKTWDQIHIDKNQLFEFKFWDKNDMKKLLNMIYTTYKYRTK